MSWPVMLLAAFATVALMLMLLTAVGNARAMPRLTPSPPVTHARLSVLIPARDEARSIAATVQSLLSYPDPTLEILVLDDGSADGTADVARAAAGGDPRLRVLGGAPLPVGWLGKTWACHQLSQAARGSILIFTDADVIWEPESVNALLHCMANHDADLLTVWPTQETVAWGERLLVPLMAMAVLAYLPLPMAHDPRMIQAAAANGQCMAFRRCAYGACGGHASVAGKIVEDVALAEQIKRVGLKLRTADGSGLIHCRMYRSSLEAIDGYTKNILAGHRNSYALLALSTALHLLLFVMPWLWLGAGFYTTQAGWPLWPLALASLGVAVRMLTARATGQRAGDALLMPISALLMTAIAGRAVLQQLRYGGPRWKGRVVSERTAASHAAPAASKRSPHV